MKFFLLFFLFFSETVAFATNYSKFEPLQAKVTVIEQKSSMLDTILNFFIVIVFFFSIFFSFFLLNKLKKINLSDFDKKLFLKIKKMFYPLRISIILMILTGFISFLINFFILFLDLKLPLNLIFTLNSNSITGVLRNSLQLTIVVVVIYFIFEIWVEKKLQIEG